MKSATATTTVVLALVSSVAAFSPAAPLRPAFASSSSLRMAADSDNPFQLFMDSIKSITAKKELEPEVPKLPDVVIDPDFKAAIGFTAVGTLLIVANHALPGYFVGGFFELLAAIFALQATRVRFVFDETSFELKMGGDKNELSSSGENFVVGGANRWTYDSFVNYDFFPSVDIPILVYFKETQTPSDQWTEGPGQLDKVGGGQIHFFPCICNAQQIKEEFEIRGCAKLEE